MQFEEFVGKVQNKGRIGSQGAAMRAICATLETLGERLHGDEADNLGAQLPAALSAYLRLARQKETFGLQEFFNRVAEREGEGVDLPEAAHHARVVIDVLQEAISVGQINDARAQLPEEYDALFESGATGKMKVETE